MQFDTLLMYSIFYIFRGVKLSALRKVVAMTSSRSRRKKNEDDIAQLKEDIDKDTEDIKPLVVCKKVGKKYINKLEKQFVVDCETYLLLPASACCWQHNCNQVMHFLLCNAAVEQKFFVGSKLLRWHPNLLVILAVQALGVYYVYFVQYLLTKTADLPQSISSFLNQILTIQ